MGRGEIGEDRMRRRGKREEGEGEKKGEWRIGKRGRGE